MEKIKEYINIINDIFTTTYNLENTMIFTKNNCRWGWIQKIDNNYLYGYIERFKPNKVSKEELLEELNVGTSLYTTLFMKSSISNEYIEKTLRVPTKDDILSKYNKINNLKSNRLNEIKKLLENNKNEILLVSLKSSEIILFRENEDDWQVICLNKELNQLLVGFLDIELDIKVYSTFQKEEMR